MSEEQEGGKKGVRPMKKGESWTSYEKTCRFHAAKQAIDGKKEASTVIDLIQKGIEPNFKERPTMLPIWSEVLVHCEEREHGQGCTATARSFSRTTTSSCCATTSRWSASAYLVRQARPSELMGMENCPHDSSRQPVVLAVREGL